jgi:Nucleotide-diphospho-sugar transferase
MSSSVFILSRILAGATPLANMRRGRLLLLLLSHFLAAILAFYWGSSVTARTLEMESGHLSCGDSCFFGTSHRTPGGARTAAQTIQDFLTESMTTTTKTKMTAHGDVFPVASMGRLVAGAAHISRRDFLHTFQLGIPLDDDDDDHDSGDDGATSKGSTFMQNVLLLYPSVNSLADDESATRTRNKNQDGNDENLQQQLAAYYPRQLTAQAATANCRVMKVILTQPSSMLLESDSSSSSSSNNNTCIAIMGHHVDSYRIQKYARRRRHRHPQSSHSTTSSVRRQQQQQQPEEKVMTTKFQLVPWQYQNDETQTNTKPLRLQTPPKPVVVRQAWQALQSYLSVYQDAVQQLRPMVEHIVAAQHETTKNANNDQSHQSPRRRPGLIVMVCNYGHVELLINFYCAARAIGMDLSRVLLFATDVETLQVARQQLGGDNSNDFYKKNIFYHEGLFSNIPTDAATTYGSLDYGAIMMAKVYVAHLLTLVGEYDFLFHDVDIVPYRPDYLDHLLDKAATPTNKDNGGSGNNDNDDFDLYFQYDHLKGGPVEYQPWYANSGFYLVRHNARTRYFFSALVRQGDLILRSKSHQTVMTALLNEHVSLYGLRVKVLQEEADMFPGICVLLFLFSKWTGVFASVLFFTLTRFSCWLLLFHSCYTPLVRGISFPQKVGLHERHDARKGYAIHYAHELQ